MPEELITVKMSRATLQRLRLIAAQTGEKQYEVLSRLLATELEKVFAQTGGTQ